uniref:Putative tail assembly chaperone n=1 Tax=viral metagenome TaxID=1070528 RepID=A0A6M3J569_9ZZZZ
MTKHYTPKKINLRWALACGLATLSVGLLTHAAHAEALKDNPPERQAFERFAVLSCGLTAEQVKQMKTPDWNTLRLALSDVVSKPSSFFFEQAGVKFDPDNPVLLQPITADAGHVISEIKLEVPDVGATDIMASLPTTEQRSEFITMNCTGLSKTELARLSVPDWNHLQGRLNAFLNEPADSFLVETSKS